MQAHMQPSNLASIQESGQRKEFALEIARRIAKFQRTNTVKEYAFFCELILYELVPTVYILAGTLPQVEMAISSLPTESYGLHSVRLTALLKGQSLSQCATGNCALIF